MSYHRTGLGQGAEERLAEIAARGCLTPDEKTFFGALCAQLQTNVRGLGQFDDTEFFGSGPNACQVAALPVCGAPVLPPNGEPGVPPPNGAPEPGPGDEPPPEERGPSRAVVIGGIAALLVAVGAAVAWRQTRRRR